MQFTSTANGIEKGYKWSLSIISLQEVGSNVFRIKLINYLLDFQEKELFHNTVHNLKENIFLFTTTTIWRLLRGNAQSHKSMIHQTLYRKIEIFSSGIDEYYWIAIICVLQVYYEIGVLYTTRLCCNAKEW